LNVLEIIFGYCNKSGIRPEKEPPEGWQWRFCAKPCFFASS